MNDVIIRAAIEAIVKGETTIPTPNQLSKLYRAEVLLLSVIIDIM